MLSTFIIEKKISSYPARIQEIAFELRNLVAEAAPNATEQFHSRGMSYFNKERGGPVSAGICQICLFHDHVRLNFIHGAFINDPKGYLTGNGKAKRYLTISNYSNADWEYYRNLIQQHAKFDPTNMETQEKIKMTLQDE